MGRSSSQTQAKQAQHCRSLSKVNESDDQPCAMETSLRHHQNLKPDCQAEQPSPLRCFFNALARKKPLDCRTDTNLNRCLNLLDLTALGVGSTLGLGLYVLAGQVASNKAGPGVVISFALAALASAFSALCYAEFAGRVPRAGSAYAYSYITVGEFVAFVIGWNLILEYVIGASSVARGFSGYLCFVVDHIIQSISGNQNQIGLSTFAANTTNAISHITTKAPFANITTSHPLDETLAERSSHSLPIMASIANYVAEYFDWPSILIILVLTIFILFGVKESTNVTLAFTTVNLLVVMVVVVSSVGSLSLHNWRLTKSEVPNGFGEGGFLPYGWSGVIAGSATCFFGFIGFDTIASSAEEAKNPKRNVPLSIMLSLFISFIAYMAIAVVQTLLWPYYDQNKITILPHIFSQLNMPITYWIVLLGAIAGLASSQLGGMYPLPRILYSMAQDKLIYSYLSHVNRRLQLPVRSTIVGSIFVAALSCLLDIQDLADMVSIGTLAAYSLVSLSVLILRYEDRRDAIDDSTIISNHLSFTDILNTIEHSPTSEESQNASGTSSERKEPPVVNNEHIPCRPKLSPKPSTPIREKGSRAVVPQLSVGFHSWFKSADVEGASESATEQIPACPILKQQSFLDLLIVWRTNDLARNRSPDNQSSKQSKVLITILVLITICLNIIAMCLTSTASGDELGDHPIVRTTSNQYLLEPRLLLVSSGSILLVVLSAVMLMLSRLPTSQSMSSEMFQVPWVPLVPVLSILVNTFLMLNLSYLTWVRFTVWMAVGLFIYFTYGIWNSEGYLLYLDRQ